MRHSQLDGARSDGIGELWKVDRVTSLLGKLTSGALAAR